MKRKKADVQKRTNDIFVYNAEKIWNDGYCPSYVEIAEAVGLSAVSTINYHIKKLIESGYMAKIGPRSNKLTITEAGKEYYRKLKERKECSL